MLLISGLDPGKQVDPAALVICQQSEVPDPLIPTRQAWLYQVVHLQQWPLGTPYATVGAEKGLGEQIRDLFTRPVLAGSTLAVDRTGVGGPVFDLLRSLNPTCVLQGITITGGENSRRDSSGYHVAKREMVSRLVALLSSRRIQIVPSLALAPVLTRQLSTFREKQKPSGSISWEASTEADHDDLVMALAICVWLGEQAPPLRRQDMGAGKRLATQIPRGAFLNRPRPKAW